MGLLGDMSDVIREAAAFVTAVSVLIALGLQVWEKILSKRRFDETQTQLAVEARKSEMAAAQVTQVKRTLEATTAKQEQAAISQDSKLDAIARVGEKTHDLCNSAMLAEKRLVAEVTRAKADLTHDPVDIAAAERAEEMYQEHRSKQLKSDDKDAAAAAGSPRSGA